MPVDLEYGLLNWAAERGYRVAWGDPGRLLEPIRMELETRTAKGEVDPSLHRQWLAGFTYLRDVGFAARTVVAVVVPRPAHRIAFASEGGLLETVVPPTYFRYRETARQVKRDLEARLDGHRLGLLSAPLKPLAARMGLVRYGRNNITYADGIGSYHQLVGMVVDAAAEPVTEPSPPAALARCEDCQLCVRACPTGAIGLDRFLLRAHRCGTLASELPGPWPQWVPASFHRCLIGCLRCQEVCPENAGLLRWETLADGFDAAETRWLLGGGPDPDGPVGRSIGDRLAALDLSADPALLRRNLAALLGNAGGKD